MWDTCFALWADFKFTVVKERFNESDTPLYIDVLFLALKLLC